MNKSTDELFEDIANMKDHDEFRATNPDKIDPEKVWNELERLALQHGVDRRLMVDRANMDRSYVEHLLNGNRAINRDKLVLLSLAGKLTLEEVQTVLKHASVAQLYPRIDRDTVIIFAFKNQQSCPELNNALENLGHDPLHKDRESKNNKEKN